MFFSLKKRGFFPLFTALFIITAVIAAAAFLLPSKILHPWLETKIKSYIAGQWHGEFDFQQLHLKLLPRPFVSITHGRLLIPEGLKANFGIFKLELAVFPLFKGKIHISRIDIFDSKLEIPPTDGGKTDLSPFLFSIDTASERISRLSASLCQRFPDLLIRVKDSTVTYGHDHGEEVQVSDIKLDLRIAEDKLTLTAGGRSTVAEMLRIDAVVSPEPFVADGKLVFDRLTLSRRLKQIHATLPDVSTTATLNGRVEFKANANSGISFILDTHAPEIKLHGDDRRFDIFDVNLSAAITYNDNSLKVRLTRLHLSKPDLNLQGRLQILDILSTTPSAVQFELICENLDLSAVRSALAFVPEESVWSVKTLDVMKGGRIPKLRISSTADSFKNLLKPDRLQLKAGLDSVRLQLPWLPQELALESGDVKLNASKLKAEKLIGVIGKSRFRQGRVALDIGAGPKKVEIDLDLTADLKDVYAVLLPILKKKAVGEVVAGITQIKGETIGRLNLNNLNGPLEANVDIGELQMRLSHKRLPEDLVITSGSLHYHTSHLTLSNLNGTYLKSRVDGLDGTFDWADQPTFSLTLSTGAIRLSLAELFAWAASFDSLRDTLAPIETLKGTCSITKGHLSGPWPDAALWSYSAKGTFKNFSLQSDRLPGPVTIAAGNLTVTPMVLSGQLQDAGLLDALVSGKFSVTSHRSEKKDVEVDGSGKIGPNVLKFFNRDLKLPHWVRLNDSVTLDHAKIHWKQSGNVAGTIALAVGKNMRLDAAGSYDDNALRMDNFRWQDAHSQFQAALEMRDTQVDYSFDGFLSSESLTQIFPEIPVRFKRLEGRLQGGLDLRDLRKMHMDGRFTLEDAAYFLQGKPVVRIKRTAVASVGNHFQIQTAELVLEENEAVIKGEVHLLEDGVLIDVDISSQHIDLAVLNQLMGPADKSGSESREKNFWEKYPIEGIVRWQIKKLQWNFMSWSDVTANVAFNGDHADLHLGSADLCGVTFSGRAFLSPDTYAFEIRPTARQLPIQSSYHCLHKSVIRVDGSFDLEGEVTGRGKTGEKLMPSLNGGLRLSAGKGRIYQDNIITKIIAFISLTEVLAGETPDWGKKGVGFESIQLNFRIDKGKVKLTEGLVNGNSMTISGQGDINPEKGTIDLTVLVAPFKTIDRIVQKIPIVNYILAGSLVSIPLRVKGALTSPEVIPLAPGAVGEGLVRVMKRTLKAPFKIIPFGTLSPSR